MSECGPRARCAARFCGGTPRGAACLTADLSGCLYAEIYPASRHPGLQRAVLRRAVERAATRRADRRCF